MKTTLFIGSVVLDMIVKLNHLPQLKEDINTESMEISIGGCAYNSCSIVDHYHLPTLLCSPIGTGKFSDLLEGLLKKENKKPFVKLKGIDNGCCLCLVNHEGERTFLCQHGAEYLFKKNWLKEIKPENLDFIYVCGLEIEDENGIEIIEYLEESNAKIFFAPSSRIMHLQKDRMERILALKPILHLNEEEALAYTGSKKIEQAGRILLNKTNALVIITCGEKGSYFINQEKEGFVEGVETQVKDTIGAGDSHAGACIAGLKQNKNIEIILRDANYIASKVVSVSGSSLNYREFKEVMHQIEIMEKKYVQK